MDWINNYNKPFNLMNNTLFEEISICSKYINGTLIFCIILWYKIQNIFELIFINK